jgi:toxin YoeB
MEIVLSEQAQKHIAYWKRTKNVKIQERIIKIKNAIILDPYKGIGNPEPLKHQLSGKWSRRIDKVNRFVYSIENNQLHIYSLKGHYDL